MTLLRVNSIPLFIEHRLRHKMWWVHPILLFALLQPIRPFAYITIGYICFLALKDYLTLSPSNRLDRSSVLLAYLTIPLLIYWAAKGQYQLYVVLVPLVVFLGISGLLLVRGKGSFFYDTVQPLFWGMMLFCFCMGHLAVILVSPDQMAPNLILHGEAIYLILLVQFSCFVLFIYRIFQPAPLTTIKWVCVGVGSLTAVFSTIIASIFIILSPEIAFSLGGVVGAAVALSQYMTHHLQNRLHIRQEDRIYPGWGGVLVQIAGYALAAPIFFYTLNLF